MRRTRFGYVRAPMPWWYMEPRRPASTDRRDVDGGVNFTDTDQLVLAAARAGLRVLPVVGRGTPDWASGNPFSVAVPPRDPADFARFVGALVRRYGPAGWFWGQHPHLRPRPIRAWQIWNEPDLRPFWDVTPWAPPYVRLLRAAHRELRRADPGAEVIAAALTNRSWEALATLYDAGARGSFDAVAIHPYTSSVGGVMTLVRRARRVMAARGDGRVPLLVSELGWPATTGHFSFGTNAQGQRRRIVQSLRRLMRARRSLRIASICVYTWLSADTGEKGTFRVRGPARDDAARPRGAARGGAPSGASCGVACDAGGARGTSVRPTTLL